jgi:hypothetical protein
MKLQHMYWKVHSERNDARSRCTNEIKSSSCIRCTTVCFLTRRVGTPEEIKAFDLLQRMGEKGAEEWVLKCKSEECHNSICCATDLYFYQVSTCGKNLRVKIPFQISPNEYKLLSDKVDYDNNTIEIEEIVRKHPSRPKCNLNCSVCENRLGRVNENTTGNSILQKKM